MTIYHPNYNAAMAHHSFQGNIEKVYLLLEKGANDYNRSLQSAIQGNQLNIVKLMVAKGATNIQTTLDAFIWGSDEVDFEIISYLVEILVINFQNNIF